MATLQDMANKLKGIDLNSMLDEILNELLPQIVDHVLEQLESGMIKDNPSPSYLYGNDSEYMKTKASMGSYDMSIAPRINLKYSGAFYSGFYAVVQQTIIEVGSKDSKANDLEREYTKELYELGSDNMIWLQNEVRPELQNLLRRELST